MVSGCHASFSDTANFGTRTVFLTDSPGILGNENGKKKILPIRRRISTSNFEAISNLCLFLYVERGACKS